jgi:hypothetical protein
MTAYAISVVLAIGAFLFFLYGALMAINGPGLNDYGPSLIAAIASRIVARFKF